MDKPAVIQGDFANYKPVLGRKVLTLYIEVPIEAQQAVFEALGYPTGGGSVPVAVARLQPPGAPKAEQPKEKRNWEALEPAQQAGIRCNEEAFWRFLTPKFSGPIDSAEGAAQAVRSLCCVASRAELNNGRHRVLWHQYDLEYQAWLREPLP